MGPECLSATLNHCVSALSFPFGRLVGLSDLKLNAEVQSRGGAESVTHIRSDFRRGGHPLSGFFGLEVSFFD